MRASTSLCSHIFILAESSINAGGQPSSLASSLRSARPLSMSSNFSRSTMDVFQLSFCGLSAARFSSCATTSTTGTAAGVAGVTTRGGGGAVAVPVMPGFLPVARMSGVAACAVPNPSFSRILVSSPIGIPLRVCGLQILSLSDGIAAEHPAAESARPWTEPVHRAGAMLELESPRKEPAMNYIATSDKTRLYVKDWGSGTPVILIHGWPLSADSWDDQAMAIANAGYRAIAYD